MTKFNNKLLRNAKLQISNGNNNYFPTFSEIFIRFYILSEKVLYRGRKLPVDIGISADHLVDVILQGTLIATFCHLMIQF